MTEKTTRDQTSARTVDDALRDLFLIHAGRTHYPGQLPRDDELLVREIERLRGVLARCGNVAAMCRSEMQGRLSDDEHRRAFNALGAIQLEALGGSETDA